MQPRLSIRKTAAGSRFALRFMVAGAILLAASEARAQLSGSVSIVSDYRYRGVSLSNGHPEPQAQVAYDGKAGWYVGGLASGVDLVDDKSGDAQLLAYAGYSGRRSSGIGWEFGALKSLFLRGAGYNYLEGFAGVAADNFSGRLYFSPDYFGEHARTLYAEFNGSYPLWRRTRFFGHVGFLHVFQNSTRFTVYSTDHADFSLGLSAGLAQWRLQLAWIAGKQIRNEEFQGSASPRSHTWVLNASVSF